MKYTEEELDQKIRTQELVCMVNGWLLEHYENQRALLETDKESPTAGLSDWGLEDGNHTWKEFSAYGEIIHQ